MKRALIIFIMFTCLISIYYIYIYNDKNQEEIIIQNKDDLNTENTKDEEIICKNKCKKKFKIS